MQEPSRESVDGAARFALVNHFLDGRLGDDWPIRSHFATRCRRGANAGSFIPKWERKRLLGDPRRRKGPDTPTLSRLKIPRIAAGSTRDQRKPKYPTMNKTMTTRPTSQMILFTRFLLCVVEI
jgi:hypothetical protein